MRMRIKFEDGSFRDIDVPDATGLPVAVRCDWADDASDGTTDEWFCVAPAAHEWADRAAACRRLTSPAHEVIVQG